MRNVHAGVFSIGKNLGPALVLASGGDQDHLLPEPRQIFSNISGDPAVGCADFGGVGCACLESTGKVGNHVKPRSTKYEDRAGPSQAIHCADHYTPTQ